MKKLLSAVAAVCLLALGACAGGSDGKSQATNIDAAYSVVRIGAALYVAMPECGSDRATTMCSDPAVKAQIAKALAVADAAITEAKREVAASGADRTAVETWTSRAMSAIAVLSVALQTYGVK